MTQIFLVRHGEAEGNLYRRVQGQNDTSLTPKGRRQVLALAPRFADVPLAAVYASDLRRAADTARAALGERELPIRTDRRLREICLGVWQDRPWGEINRDSMEQKTFFLTDPEKWSIPGAESYAALQDRMEEVLSEIGRRHEGGAVLCASHGMAIRSFLARVRGVPSCRFSEVRMPYNASVTVLRWEDGRFAVESENDTGHLPEPPYVPFRSTGRDRPEESYDLWFAPFDMAGGRETYLACYRDAWRQAHGSLRGFDAESCWRGALVRAADSPAAVSAAWRGEDMAGLLALDERRGAGRGVGWVAFLYVLPAFRGRHCGVQLLGEAISRYRALGRSVLRLTVAPGNPALGFYRRAGFRQAGTEPGAVEPLLVMEMEI